MEIVGNVAKKLENEPVLGETNKQLCYFQHCYMQFAVGVEQDSTESVSEM